MSGAINIFNWNISSITGISFTHFATISCNNFELEKKLPACQNVAAAAMSSDMERQ